jgi:hypothetical protein
MIFIWHYIHRLAYIFTNMMISTGLVQLGNNKNRVVEKGVNDDFIKYTALNELKESRTIW